MSQRVLGGPFPPVQREGSPRRWRTLAAIGALLLLFAGGALFLRSRRTVAEPRGAGAPGGAASRPVPVVTAQVVARDVPIYLDGLGNAVPISTVTVRSRVDGRLDRVLFKEGQTV